jgi:hypothetical protein
MEFRILETLHNGKVFKIEEDYPEVGVYLYVYEDDQCVNDYLQNDIETCKELAFEDFGVPLCSWKENTSSNEEE